MKDILTSPRMEDLKRKRKARRVRLTILFSVLFISIVSALAYFSGNHRVTINNIKVTGTRIINISEVEDTTRELLAGKYVYLFARSNSLIYPKSAIYNKILEKFPRISTLSINRKGLNSLDIVITERAGAFLYCGSQIPELYSMVGENCYFINNDGYIFDKAPYFSGNVYFKYYAPLSNGITNPLSTALFSPDRFHSIARFIDGIEALGFKPTDLIIGPEGNNIYLEHTDSATKPVIMFTDDNNLEDILNNLTLSMNKPEFANEIRSKYTTLLYIDLRFKNKVLYKFQ